MSDNPLPPEFDDELLSAYLDDELAPHQRAVVEGHLASDPAARQLLDELRHVSQAVRGLPQQKLRQDLRETILQKLGDAARPAAPVNRDENAPALPKLTIGRTRRGWLWASLAVAAALLIMLTQGEVRESHDRPVAFRQREAPSLTAAPEAAPPEAASYAGREAAESKTTDAFTAVGEATSAPPADSAAPAAPTQSATQSDELVVVHVLAKREALENKAFDQLLVNNGVSFELAPRAADRAAGATRYEAPAAASGRAENQAAPPRYDTLVEAVLVEAPPQTIEMCLDELNKDSSNYLGVEVGDSLPAEQPPAPQSPRAKKFAVDLGKYNRGAVPQRQKDLFALDKSQYSSQSPGVTTYGGSGGTLAPSAGAQPNVRQWTKQEKVLNEGRAQRLLIQDADIGRAQERLDLRRQLKVPAERDRANLQVLFVLAPGDEPAASPPADYQTE
jgi:anti-sigma factor RsiW